MSVSLVHKTFVLLALLLWLMSSWTGVYGHFCFDGQEPPVSIHLDNLNTHDEHDVESAHVDMDVDLSQSVIAKLLKFDAPLPLLLISILVLLVLSQAPYFSFPRTCHPRRVIGVRPPPRAPPSTPV